MCAMSLARHRSKSIESCTTTQGASSKTSPNAQKIGFERRDGRMQSSLYADKNCQCICLPAPLKQLTTHARLERARKRDCSHGMPLIHCTLMLRMSCAEPSGWQGYTDRVLGLSVDALTLELALVATSVFISTGGDRRGVSILFGLALFASPSRLPWTRMRSNDGYSNSRRPPNSCRRRFSSSVLSSSVLSSGGVPNKRSLKNFSSSLALCFSFPFTPEKTRLGGNVALLDKLAYRLSSLLNRSVNLKTSVRCTYRTILYMVTFSVD